MTALALHLDDAAGVVESTGNEHALHNSPGSPIGVGLASALIDLHERDCRARICREVIVTESNWIAGACIRTCR